MALGLTQPLAELSTTSVSWGERLPMRWGDDLATFMYQLKHSRSLNLEPQEPVHVCITTDLPLPL